MTEISIIVPAYNEEKDIGRCLKALVDQDFDKDKYEIIIVNNPFFWCTLWFPCLFQQYPQ